MKYIKLFEEHEEIATDIPVPKKKWLYHVTNAKHLSSIRQVGLIPEWGEVVRTTYGNDYDLDNRKQDFGGGSGNYYQEDEEDEDGEGKYDTEGNRLSQLPFDGILFFATEPHIMYSHFTKMEDFNWNDVVIVVVENNETIYRKSDSKSGNCDVYNYEGELVGDVKYGWEYIGVYELPRIIETGDYFSLEEQEPLHILSGVQAKSFVTQYYPQQISLHASRHPHIAK